MIGTIRYFDKKIDEFMRSPIDVLDAKRCYTCCCLRSSRHTRDKKRNENNHD